jgi:polyhydroxybutyrate depolymerase
MRFLGLAAILLACVSSATAANIVDRTMARPEGQRHYIVAEPAGLAPEKRPVVILLHGHGTSAAIMLGLKGFGSYKNPQWMVMAEREKVLLIAPDGTKGSDGKAAWNDCRLDAPTNATSDDVGFISALIDTAIADLHADPERIYVFGTSHGGFMTYRLAGELGQRLAAVGVESAAMPVQTRCKPPAHPLPLFAAHGTADEIVPYGGGKLGSWILKGRGTASGVEASIDLWRRLDGLPEAPAAYKFPHLRASDSTSATRYVWGSDPHGLQVEFLRIDGGGHTPASTAEELPWLLRKLVGEMNHDLNTSDEAWKFFKDKCASSAKKDL